MDDQQDQGGVVASKEEKNNKRNVKIALMSIVGVVVVAGAFGVGYYKGNVEGRKETIVDTVQRVFEGTELVKVPISSTGKVTSVSADSITVDVDGEGERTARVEEYTPITRKGGDIELGDIRNDEQTTIYMVEDDEGLRATRIIVR